MSRKMSPARFDQYLDRKESDRKRKVFIRNERRNKQARYRFETSN